MVDCSERGVGAELQKRYYPPPAAMDDDDFFDDDIDALLDEAEAANAGPPASLDEFEDARALLRGKDGAAGSDAPSAAKLVKLLKLFCKNFGGLVLGCI